MNSTKARLVRLNKAHNNRDSENGVAESKPALPTRRSERLALRSAIVFIKQSDKKPDTVDLSSALTSARAWVTGTSNQPEKKRATYRKPSPN